MTKTFEIVAEGISLVRERLTDGCVVHNVHVHGVLDIGMCSESEAIELAHMLARAAWIHGPEGWSP